MFNIEDLIIHLYFIVHIRILKSQLKAKIMAQEVRFTALEQSIYLKEL